MLDHDTIVRAAATLEPLSPTAVRLAALVSAEDAGIAQIEPVVALDPALTGRLLRYANSAAQGRRAPVGTVRAALLHVGIGRAFSLAVAESIRRSARRALPQYGLSEGDLWRHLVAAALAVEVLPAAIRAPVPPETFTAALLHDVGKVLMARFLDAEALEFLARARAHGAESSLRAERDVLGVHHGEVSALAAQAWHLPERVVQAVAHHAFPDEVEDLLCDIVHVADVAATRVGQSAGVEPDEAVVQAGPAARLRLDAAAFDDVLATLRERFAEVAQIYGG